MTACMLHKSQKSKLKFATLNKESNMSTLWRRGKFLRICSKEELAEKAQDIEAKIPVTGKKRSRGTVQPRSRVFLRYLFLGQATDGVAINDDVQIEYILEFKLSTNRDEGFL